MTCGKNYIDISNGKGEKLIVFYSNIYVNFPPGAVKDRERKNVTRYDFCEMKCFFKNETRDEIDESIFCGEFFSRNKLPLPNKFFL